VSDHRPRQLDRPEQREIVTVGPQELHERVEVNRPSRPIRSPILKRVPRSSLSSMRRFETSSWSVLSVLSQTDPEGVLRRCYDSSQALVAELPDRGFISIRPVEEDDDLVNQLIEHNPAFRGLLAKSIASPREPFPFGEL
jgi:hypothetical protein